MASSRSAAAPATWGADADVPRNPGLGGIGFPSAYRQAEGSTPYTDPLMPSGPVMSGPTRPSMVGPRPEYDRTVASILQCAPTDSTDSDDAGSGRLEVVSRSRQHVYPSK